jgi:cbb3-type cytochrome oxidase subunit 3
VVKLILPMNDTVRSYYLSSSVLLYELGDTKYNAISGSRTPLVITVVAIPLAALMIGLLICYICFKNRNRRREARAAAAALAKANHASLKEDKSAQLGSEGSSCCTNCCCCCVLKPQSSRNQDSTDEKCHPTAFGEDSAPITRGPIYFKNDIE